MRPSLSGFFRVMKGFFDGHIQLCESLRQGAGVLPDDAQDRPHAADGGPGLAGLQEDSKQRYVPPVAFAMVHCGLGEKNEAVRWLERAYEERAGGIASLKVRPVWSDLHSEPGFVKLLARMGLTK